MPSTFPLTKKPKSYYFCPKDREKNRISDKFINRASAIVHPPSAEERRLLSLQYGHDRLRRCGGDLHVPFWNVQYFKAIYEIHSDLGLVRFSYEMTKHDRNRFGLSSSSRTKPIGQILNPRSSVTSQARSKRGWTHPLRTKLTTTTTPQMKRLCFTSLLDMHFSLFFHGLFIFTSDNWSGEQQWEFAFLQDVWNGWNYGGKLGIIRDKTQ